MAEYFQSLGGIYVPRGESGRWRAMYGEETVSQYARSTIVYCFCVLMEIALFTQRLNIGRIVNSAFGKWNDMIHREIFCRAASSAVIMIFFKDFYPLFISNPLATISEFISPTTLVLSSFLLWVLFTPFLIAFEHPIGVIVIPLFGLFFNFFCVLLVIIMIIFCNHLRMIVAKFAGQGIILLSIIFSPLFHQFLATKLTFVLQAIASFFASKELAQRLPFLAFIALFENVLIHGKSFLDNKYIVLYPIMTLWSTYD